MKLSVITINRNNCLGLEATIKSVCEHVGSDFEYLVIDGKSTDDSVEIIKKYEQFISYWISEPDLGIYDAMNKGIKAAKGDYILFLNSGDSFEKGIRIQELEHELGQEDLIYFNLTVCLPDGQNFVKAYPTRLDFKYFFEDSLPHMATFIRRQLFSEYGFYDDRMKICADWAFFMKVVCAGCSYRHVDKTFSIFYADGISSMPANMQLIRSERDGFVMNQYPLLFSLYTDWMDKKHEIYKLWISRSVRMLKKAGFLKWFNLNKSE